MLFLYSCVYFLSKPKSSKFDTIFSTFFFTLALNMKMNILLFAPGFAVIYYRNLGLLKSAAHAIFGTLLLSVGLGLPFLLGDWRAYLAAAFNFSRKFEHKWTVNFRFLSEELFLDSRLHLALLAAHLAVLLYFLATWMAVACRKSTERFSPTQVVWIMFTSNFIGMAFSRSLHYQFLSWYHHTLPALLFLPQFYKTRSGLLVLGLVEFCWNTYPSTNFSSSLLHVCHAAILYGLYRGQGSIFGEASADEKKDN